MKNLFTSSTRGAQLFLATALIGSIIGIYQYGINLQSILFILIGYFVYGCLGIVVTFHRNLTHNSYSTYRPVNKIFTILGTLAGTGSPLAWIAIHINHHLNSDKTLDPHSPHTKGWKIFLLNYDHEVDSSTKWRMRKFITDPFHQLLHRYYFLIILFWDFLLLITGGLWLVVFAHWAPVVLTALMSNVVNYVGHKPSWWGGFRTYNLSDQSANNWVWAIPSWGESWHNNHHRNPKNYSSGQGWQLDISGLIIKLIKIK